MTDSILHWNLIALNALKADFSLPDPRPPELMPQQNGPTYAARAGDRARGDVRRLHGRARAQ